uniref:TNFR-Cys domain-containing protein n=2 Tax=Echeneis naucrates TaxID=173247 RepID=A0A665SWX7_ECHNA
SEPVPTFSHRDPRTGETLVCEKCPRGTHMTAHCTASTPTRCERCGEHQFTEMWNYLPRCLYCDNFCTDNQEVEVPCSPSSNTVCRCKQGFYWIGDFCVRHSECEAGQGVVTTGTPKTDTVCEWCPEGFFSNSSSALETCAKHQECATGETALLPGSVYQDTICGTCEELAKRGEVYRSFLSGLFGMHRMRVAKLKKFVTRNIDKSIPRQRGPLLQEIREWLATAPEEQLRKLPQMLRASQLNAIADKLEKRFQEIKQDNPDCVLTL